MYNPNLTPLNSEDIPRINLIPCKPFKTSSGFGAQMSFPEKKAAGIEF